MVFRISKIHTNADFTFSNNKCYISLEDDIGIEIEILYTCSDIYIIARVGETNLYRRRQIFHTSISFKKKEITLCRQKKGMCTVFTMRS